MSENLVNVTVDGRAVAVPRGTNLIEAAKQAGVEVPHYCYHRNLSIAGNCRMCLVEVGTPKLTPEKKPELGPDGQPVIAFMPKLQIACNTPVSEGMVCLTRSPKVEKARQGVMEFLLINHPLDCPICDQAGECRLQEFAVDYGKGGSRFVENKVKKPKRVPLGPKIMLDNERCIMCSRCERFMREVAKQDCLGFVSRGGKVELTCYPERWPNTNYDLNIVDICPVGALTSTDFRFRMRPWFLKETRSICPHCANGCNTLVWTRNNVVYRQTPRDNDAVNMSWMCDYGRLNYKYIDDPKRLKVPTLGGEPTTWTKALHAAAEGLSALGKAGALAAVGSARASTEEQFLFARLAKDLLGVRLVDCAPRTGPADELLLKADRNPNAAGARLTGIAAEPLGSILPRIAMDIRSGKVRGLIVHGEDVTKHGIDADLLAKLELLVVIDILPSATTERAQIVLPGAAFAEKRGTFINGAGRLQRFNAAIEPPETAQPDTSILGAIINELNPTDALHASDVVFDTMTREIAALRGLTFSSIGDGGVDLAAHLTGPARENDRRDAAQEMRT
jgi:NADH-quinone oxidoreductase subunit G